MKLSDFGVRLFEEDLEKLTAEEYWKSHSTGAKKYTSAEVYEVKANGDKYDVFTTSSGSRKKFGSYTAVQLKDLFKPLQPSQTPDVEGFIKYTDPTVNRAIQHSGDPLQIDLGDQTKVLNDGDYLMQTVNGTKFVYVVVPSAEFEDTFKPV
jgi:hypothetical protein